MEEVTSIEPLGRIYKISTTKQEYHANSIILSTGSRHRPLNVPGETEFLGKGVCYCATCDGPLFAGKDVLMIGGGNSAAQEALFLKNIGCNVTIVHRRDQLRADKYLKEKLEEHEIPIIWDSDVEEIKGNVFVETVVLNNKKTSQKTEVSVSGVFIAIGDEPINQLAKDLGLDIDHNGYIITDKFQRTNLERVYAAGDITGGVNQWIVACSEGAVAATAAFEDLQKM
jgi:thioredoxin reductase (NADPH)